MRAGFITAAEAGEAFRRFNALLPRVEDIVPRHRIEVDATLSEDPRAQEGAIVRRQGENQRGRVVEVHHEPVRAGVVDTPEGVRSRWSYEVLLTVQWLGAYPPSTVSGIKLEDVVLVQDAAAATAATRQRMNRVDPRVAVASGVPNVEERALRRLAEVSGEDLEALRDRLTRALREDMDRRFLHGSPLDRVDAVRGRSLGQAVVDRAQAELNERQARDAERRLQTALGVEDTDGSWPFGSVNRKREAPPAKRRRINLKLKD